jgi:hypothetical protein
MSGETKRKVGRPSLFGRPMTNAERLRRSRERRREKLPWENTEESDAFYEFTGRPYLKERNL